MDVLQIGSQLPTFQLGSTEGKIIDSSTVQIDKGLVVFFTCNHCPYVVGSDSLTIEMAKKYQSQGINFIAISSNSAASYPEDAFTPMIIHAKKMGYPWPYLYDDTQMVAKSFGALKTPHFFLFDASKKLVYSGRAVDSPRDLSKKTTHELEDALNQLLAGNIVTVAQTEPVGCSIKWHGLERIVKKAEVCDLK